MPKLEVPLSDRSPVNGWKSFLSGKACLILAVLSVCGTALYLPFLSAPFYFDDWEMIVRNPYLRHAWDWQDIWIGSYSKTRFLTFWTYALNFQWGGMQPWGYRLFNLILHGANAGFLYLLVLRLPTVRMNTKYSDPRLDHATAFLTAVIFLTHPLQTQAVIWISARSELLSAFFSFLVLHLYLSFRETGRSGYIVWAILAFTAGFFTRGTIIMVPLLIFCIETVLGGLTGKAFWAGYGRLTAVAGAACAVLFFSYKNVLGFLGLHWLTDGSQIASGIYFLTQLRVVTKYIQMAFLPVGQNLDYDFPLSSSLAEPRTLAAFLFLAGCLALAGMLARRNRAAAFGAFWFFITLIPVSTFLPLPTVISENRMYFPLAGFSLFAASLLLRIPARHLRTTISIICIVVLAGLTLRRGALWNSPLEFYQDAVRKSPQNVRMRHELGVAYFEAGDMDRAMEQYHKAMDLNPDFSEVYNSFGLVLMSEGRAGEAQEAFHRSIAVDPAKVAPYLNLAYLAMARGDLAEAGRELNKSLHRRETETAWLGLGHIQLIREDFERAKAYFEFALSLNPHSAVARFYIGQSESAVGHDVRAERMFLDAMRKDPSFLGPYQSLAELYRRTGNPAKADAVLNSVPAHSQEKLNLWRD